MIELCTAYSLAANDATARDIAAKIGRCIKGDAEVIRSGCHWKIKGLGGICGHLVYSIIGTSPGVKRQCGGRFVVNVYSIASATPD